MSKHRTRITRRDRLLSGVLCLALALSLLPAVGLVQPARAASWADPYAEQLVEWGIMSPASDLRLGDTITRAEFVALCNHAFGYKKLGGTPFTDVPSSEWYAEDIDIAYNAGYFNGTSATTASPYGLLTREQAAVVAARILMLQETVGESLGFTDSRELSEWSRGLIGAAKADGLISGFTDGSFRPFNTITRGEVAAMLVHAIGNPISEAGSYEMNEVYGNVVISCSNVTLRDTVILGNLYVTGGVDLGNVLLENVTVLGRIVISGGGESDSARSSVILRNVAADELSVDSLVNQFVTVSTYGLTDIPVTYVRSDAYLEDSCAAGYGLHRIELVGEPGAKLQLAGGIKEVVNKTPRSLLQLVSGTAKKITIDEYAIGSELLVDINTRVDELNLDVATRVYGEGDIIDLNIGAESCEVEILPEHVNVRPGITATVDDKVIGSSAAAELSSEPRLLAGYPSAANLRPNQAEGLYAGNKPGTIYWAVSSITDGSVTMENLIHNPVYGGNIFKNGDEYQSGSVDAGARTEYGRLISGLEPDGSYYISAVLVDERGNRSPLKVISFRTPDDTVPAFVEGYPYMSLVTCETAQVTVMANKSCQLYWVLLPAGAVAPTVQNFRSGSFGGNFGRGSQSVTKNVPTSIKVNTNRLQESTDFDLYLWLNDFDGTLSSEVVKVPNPDTGKDTDPSFHTPDETPPVVFDVTQNNFSLPDAIEFTFRINEAPSTLYWAVVTESNDTFIASNADMNSAAVQIKVENGTKAGAIVGGSQAADGVNVDTQVGAAAFANSLKYETYKTHNFKLYYVAKDADGNYSAVDYITIHTKDAEPPIVSLDDTNTMDGKYQADGDLRLIFTEQVKGSNKLEDDTFVDFYSLVLAYQTADAAVLNDAKDRLAKELAAHIELIYKPKTVEENDDTLDGDKNNPHGWIDWREARVELQSDGRVFLTLPYNEAISLGSGMDYCFRFTDIYDDSYDHNRLGVMDGNGNIIDGGKETDEDCELYFSTIYATVWLSKDRSGVSEFDTGEKDKDGNPIMTSLDIVFDLNPKTTRNMSSNEYWDMVIWNTNNIPCKFDVYRSVDNGDKWDTWEKVAEGATIYGQNMPAVSLNHFKTVDYISNTPGLFTDYEHGLYETVKGGLAQDSTYKYAIHFTEVNGSTDRESWTKLLKMEVRLVAGERGNIRTLEDSVYDVDGAYKRLVDTEKVLSEISAVNLGAETVTCLEVEKQFTDDSVPSFWTGFPTLASTSSTITMEIALSRAGNVYYVVAPAGTIPTSIKDGDGTIAITSDNDGTEGGKGTQPSESQKTYIPLNGDDITAVIDDNGNTNESMIYFRSGEENDRKYTAPAYGSIFAGTYTDPEGVIKKGSIEYSEVKRVERVTGLHPDTWYYVYMVLQSDSNKIDEVVQIYRVKTLEAHPPTIAVSHPGTTATIEVRDPEATSNDDQLYDNPDVYYAIVRKDDLPKWFFWQYQWTEIPKDDATGGNLGDATGGNLGDAASQMGPYKPDQNGKYSGVPGGAVNVMTVLEAMITTVQGEKGRTYFDLYADQFASPENSTSSNSLKYEVMSYITRANSNDGYGNSMSPYGPINNNNPSYEYNDTDMKSGGEYVMLVCARHHEKTADDVSAYGFAASQGLYLPDEDPPEFISMTGLVEVNFKHVYNATGVEITEKNWRNTKDIPFYTYGGTLQFSFDKPIYYSVNGALMKVVNKTSNLASNEISIIRVINAAGFSVTPGKELNDGMNFDLTFDKIGNSAGFIMRNLCNSTGVSIAPGASKAKQLTVKFNTWLTMADTKPDPDGNYLLMYTPAFEITWE